MRGRDAEPQPPIETYLRIIDQPTIRLASIDLGATAELDVEVGRERPDHREHAQQDGRELPDRRPLFPQDFLGDARGRKDRH